VPPTVQVCLGAEDCAAGAEGRLGGHGVGDNVWVTVPTSATQLLIVLVLIVPGFVYQGVRIRLRGRTVNEQELSARIMHALVASTVFALFYVMLAGASVADAGHLQDAATDSPRRYAVLGFAAAFVIPPLAAALVTWLGSAGWWRPVVDRMRPKGWRRVDPTPTAWDVAFQDLPAGCYVRVRTRDGDWFAGWFGSESYASSWPDPRSLFVEQSFHIDQDGVIGDLVEGTAGAVINCEDALLVELLQPRTP
jgi:hypothetical protein